eukprot:4387299-Pleurochrysis_carterae.AAC.1
MPMRSLDMAPSLSVVHATSSSSIDEPVSRAPPTIGMRPCPAKSRLRSRLQNQTLVKAAADRVVSDEAGTAPGGQRTRREGLWAMGKRRQLEAHAEEGRPFSSSRRALRASQKTLYSAGSSRKDLGVKPEAELTGTPELCSASQTELIEAASASASMPRHSISSAAPS